MKPMLGHRLPYWIGKANGYILTGMQNEVCGAVTEVVVEFMSEMSEKVGSVFVRHGLVNGRNQTTEVENEKEE
jgi:hypothetical protein